MSSLQLIRQSALGDKTVHCRFLELAISQPEKSVYCIIHSQGQLNLRTVDQDNRITAPCSFALAIISRVKLDLGSSEDVICLYCIYHGLDIIPFLRSAVRAKWRSARVSAHICGRKVTGRGKIGIH